MSLHSGERQVGSVLGGIRKDHTERYYWAAHLIQNEFGNGANVIDLGCGCGYGSYILSCYQCGVIALDNDQETIEYAKTAWPHPIMWECFDINNIDDHWAIKPAFDAAVCFEVIEHLSDPKPFLEKLSKCVNTLYASVPNEDGFKFTGQQFHHRHYTREQFFELLNECGWRVIELVGQTGIESDVEQLSDSDLRKCRTLVVAAMPV